MASYQVGTVDFLTILTNFAVVLDKPDADSVAKIELIFGDADYD